MEFFFNINFANQSVFTCFRALWLQYTTGSTGLILLQHSTPPHFKVISFFEVNFVHEFNQQMEDQMPDIRNKIKDNNHFICIALYACLQSARPFR